MSFENHGFVLSGENAKGPWFDVKRRHLEFNMEFLLGVCKWTLEFDVTDTQDDVHIQFPRKFADALVEIQVFVDDKPPLKSTVLKDADARAKFEERKRAGEEVGIAEGRKEHEGILDMSFGNLVKGSKVSIEITSCVQARVGRGGETVHLEAPINLFESEKWCNSFSINWNVGTFVNPGTKLDIHYDDVSFDPITVGDDGTLATKAPLPLLKTSTKVLHLSLKTSKQLPDAVSMVEKTGDALNIAMCINPRSLHDKVEDIVESKGDDLHHVILVLDDSGSMCGKRSRHLREALSIFIPRLPEGTLVTMITFGSSPQMQGDRTPVTEGNVESVFPKLIDSVKGMSGGTNVLSALEFAATKALDSVPNDVILFTDGDVSNTRDVIDWVREHGQMNFSTVSISDEASRTLTEGIARVSGGDTFHVPSDHKPAMIDAMMKLSIAVSRERIHDVSVTLEITPFGSEKALTLPQKHVARNLPLEASAWLFRSISLNFLPETTGFDVAVHVKAKTVRNKPLVSVCTTVFQVPTTTWGSVMSQRAAWHDIIHDNVEDPVKLGVKHQVLVPRTSMLLLRADGSQPEGATSRTKRPRVCVSKSSVYFKGVVSLGIDSSFDDDDFTTGGVTHHDMVAFGQPRSGVYSSFGDRSDARDGHRALDRSRAFSKPVFSKGPSRGRDRSARSVVKMGLKTPRDDRSSHEVKKERRGARDRGAKVDRLRSKGSVPSHSHHDSGMVSLKDKTIDSLTAIMCRKYVKGGFKHVPNLVELKGTETMSVRERTELIRKLITEFFLTPKDTAVDVLGIAKQLVKECTAFLSS